MKRKPGGGGAQEDSVDLHFPSKSAVCNVGSAVWAHAYRRAQAECVAEEDQREVSQCLKRMVTIVDKLCARGKGMDLSRMRDIGGCRVVLATDSIDDLNRLAEHTWAAPSCIGSTTG